MKRDFARDSGGRLDRGLSTLRRCERWLHDSFLYGATGIVAFGWVACAAAGWSAAPWMGLWWAAALFLYNVDRLRVDPADFQNVPVRAAAAAASENLRRASVAAAAGYLILWPAWTRDWVTLGLVLGGGGFALHYSLPLRGRRLKDVPGLKTFFAPTGVMLAVLGLPWVHGATGMAWGGWACGAAWGYLLFNMTLCDLRDHVGDRLTGVRSVPVLLGPAGSRRLLLGLLAATQGAILVCREQAPFREFWGVLAWAVPIYLGSLWWAVRAPRSERFYEWAVEGLLYLPLLAWWWAT